MPSPEFHVFLPQMRISPEGLVARAQAAEAAGFAGVALMDHLAPPMAEDQPMFEAMTTATWLAARTSRLTIGHLVLCDSFRHPALLARQAVTLDHLSEGRYELAIGSGSTPDELKTFGISSLKGRERTARLRESLEVLTRLWTGDPVTFDGRYHQLDGAQQLPTPTRPIPLIVGGTGPATLEIVREFATWWNLPTHQGARLEECRPLVGGARVSLQQMVTFVPDGADRQQVTDQADRRFGAMGDMRAVGSGEELVATFTDQQRRGVERFYVWFTDFAPPETLRAFGSEVIDRFA
jgi:alkanesulfonate monooxygenase SsuD/methylene tetrahydromethanopterin reductase-like flavin-dependent oxidoreductase (luciferase family)